MINIFYNPAYPELAFAMAAFVYNLPEKEEDELIDYIPIKVSDLNKNIYSIRSELDKEIKIVWGENFFEDGEEDDAEPVKYALFGIYPKNDQENAIINKFFDKHKEQIMLWIDWHQWPENLAKYLQDQSDKLIFSKIKTSLEVMQENKCNIPPMWLAAEKAIVTHDMTNILAMRYWKTFLASSAIGKNLFAERGAQFAIFSTVISEIIDDKEDEEISKLEVEYDQTLFETEDLIARFDGNNELFAKAKECGRQVGCLILEEVTRCFNSDEIMQGGLDKFPWLCIVRYKVNGYCFILFGSVKLPIHDLVTDYQDCMGNEGELLGILNAELLRFKEENA